MAYQDSVFPLAPLRAVGLLAWGGPHFTGKLTFAKGPRLQGKVVRRRAMRSKTLRRKFQCQEEFWYEAHVDHARFRGFEAKG